VITDTLPASHSWERTMRVPILLLALCVLLPAPASAQTQTDNRQIDLKPLLPPVLPPLPRNSTLAPGSTGTGSQSPYAERLYDSPSQSTAPAPGFRFSIPTR
jgi:hypothetical protein